MLLVVATNADAFELGAINLFSNTSATIGGSAKKWVPGVAIVAYASFK